MKKMIMSLGLTLLTALSVSAQSTTDGKQPAAYQSDHHRCVMASADTWKSLGLSAEQIATVKEVQASCKAEYDAAKPADQAGSVARHEEKLKGILTPEQYKKWSEWCAKEAAATTQPGTTK